MASIFSKIIEKEIPAYIVYEDDVVIAFLDISQATKGHTLVVPKKEIVSILELDDELASHLFKVTVKLAKAIDSAFKPSGINILNNNGKSAFQTVMHYHLHVIPRYDISEVKLSFTNNADSLLESDYLERQNLIKNELLN